jgi:DNA polymerase III alpha subunit
MKTNNFGQAILDEKDVIRILYMGAGTDLSHIILSDSNLADQFNKSIKLNGDDLDLLNFYREPDCILEDFDKNAQGQWFIPEEYQHFPIEEWLLNQCQTDQEFDRVKEELILFNQYNMVVILKVLKYLVDLMRQNNIVWGIGRGSSVSSYCLYLIGVHKINSIKFNLEISEFLKGEKNEQENL